MKVIQMGNDGEQVVTLFALASLPIDVVKLPHHGVQKGSSDLHE